MTPLTLPARLSVAALVILGLVGGALIVAHSGYETSPRHGGTPTFVPAPLAYVLAAIFFVMSCLALLALLQDRRASSTTLSVAVVGYAALAWLLVQLLSPK